MTERHRDLPPGFLCLHEVLTLVPVSRSTWYRGMRTGRFPRPVRLSPGVSAWRVDDIRHMVERLQKGEGRP